MSSSVFVESSSIPKTAADSLDEHSLGSRITGTTSSVDSNLVVVYGKNGINFDRKGLENLIEEKTLSSISVIRLTSPTLSMEDEAEAERQKETSRKNIGSDEEDLNESEDLTTDERNSDDSTGDFESNIDEGSSSNIDENDSDEDNDTSTTARYKKKIAKKNTKTHAKEKFFKGRHNNERPEIVGLTVEEFYPPEDAKEMAKEILKLAGVSTIKHTADYEFQLFVIKNDHCYTPFTSPAQMKAKLAAEKIDAEKSKIVARKLLPQPFASVKQFITKKKLQQVDTPKSVAVVLKHELNDKEKIELKTRSEAKAKDADGSTENIEDDEEVITSASEGEEDFAESDITTTEISAESENDRDSDLDFDVNNRKVRKRKVQNVKLNRRSLPNKATATKQNQRHSQEDESGNLKSFATDTETMRRPSNDNVTRTPGKSLNAPIKMFTNTTLVRKGLPPPVETMTTGITSAIKKQIVVEKTMTSSTQQTTLAAPVRRGPIVQVGTPTTRNAQLSGSAGKVPASPQSVKEIVINKVIASPKGGFTNIGALLAQSDIQTVSSAPTTPTSTRSQPQQKLTPSSKGFMPLGIETAANKQLPSQISIQTHQSSSELAAEHDKQLDLIDSIVKDEMEKSSIIEKAASENENIPQLIKMLESTERALESKKTHPLNAFTGSRAVEDDIDIANAPLLETPEDEIPADLLQHVVELIEDDKTLQEAVEKQVFGEDSNVTVGSNIQTPPPQMLAMFSTQTEKIKPAATFIEKSTPTTSTPKALPQLQPKSIIQATLFNEVVTSLSSSTPLPVTPRASVSASKTIPNLRKEPIQIVRGNGRVITLPPIEAPTTRAKRRAQTQPMQNANDSLQSTLNESLDTSLQSNASFSTDSTGLTNALVLEKKSAETLARRCVSKEGSGSLVTAAKTTKKVAAKRTTKAAIKNDAAMEDPLESQEDDDDPKKLWCICRQPHNNRFMICCDSCEDWFHGTCVSITKAMGLEMEQKGIDWTCPKCVKKLEEKTQRKITDMLDFKKVVTSTPQQQQKLQFFTNNKINNDAVIEPISHTNKDINQALVDPLATTPKQNVMPKKQLIDIKKIQSGQFISLKNLEQKKLPVTVLTSGQKKQFLPLSPQVPLAKSTIPHTQPKRVIVVQKLAAPKSDAANKGITVVKSSHQQQIKFHKVPVTATNISSGKSIAHATTAKAAVIEQHVEPTTPCIVCKKPARENSIYCSDDCIRKHAQNALNAFTKPPESPPVSPYTKPGSDDKKKKPKGLFEDLLSMADRKPKVERVCVFERKSGKVLSGNNAPTTLSLKKWLQDNPTFEVVQPGSSQAIEFEKKQKLRISLPAKLSTSPSPSNSPVPDHSQASAKKINLTHSQVGSDGHTKESAIQPKALKQIAEQTKSSPNSMRPATPKQLTKYPQQVSLKHDKSQKSETKDETKSKEKSATKRNATETSNKKPVSAINSNETSAGTSDSEPIRINVRRTLKEQLIQRINEMISNSADGQTNTNKPPSTEYIEEFVQETEAEMYNYFNRDTGAKYKAKYRSLMFNIKDRKNQTLYQKICAKIINPKQLVRMSPEELASQELAQWRENEAKHQLEMIKKSELDLLSCAKNYVLKTHKGEEVIEGKSTDCVNLDITIPVEDVVAVLNNSTGVDGIENKIPTPRRDYSFADFDVTKEAQLYHTETLSSAKDKEKEKEREKERGREKEKDKDKERSHKNKDRHREKSKTRKRSRSRSRSREKRHKSSSHKDDRRDREDRDRDREKERDRDKEHSREKERDRFKDEHDKRSADKKISLASPLTVKSTPPTSKDRHKESATHTQTQSKKDSVAIKSLESFSLIDQILESTKTVEEAANLPTDKNKMDYNYPTNSKPTQSAGNHTTTSSSVQFFSQNSTDSDQEPTSTVSITSSPQDPYVAYCNSETTTTLWSGNINMIDVASFQIVVQPVIGNAVNLGKLLLEELDVVGRIGPDTVWDYISKIKKSPNKEIVILRLLPAYESETGAYTILYEYLHKRNRLGVIKTNSSQIKDFYIFPLGTGNSLPTVLLPSERVEFFEDPFRPDVLLGIVIRVIGKRLSSSTAQQSTAKSGKFQSKLISSETFTPPGSPKRKRLVSTAPKDDIDVDAIIKAPIVAKKTITPVAPTSTKIDDQDEPYSPGCSSDDDLPLLTVKATEFHKTAEEELKRKMDDLNRQIAAQEMEIAGLLNVEPSNFISTSGTGSTTVLNPSLASISIPSNLSQILASIKNIPEPPPPHNTVKATQPSAVPPPPSKGSLHRSQKNDGDEKYNPEQAIDDAYLDEGYKTQKSTTSRLAQLSEAELLSMVPDDMLNPASPPAVKKPRLDEPPPPGV